MTKIIETKDGSHSLTSQQFNATYHSIHGAIQETQTVFIDAALQYKATNQQQLAILGIGFGTGLNAFMTYLAANRQQIAIQYTGVEAYPISLATAQQLNYPSILGVEEEQAQFLKLHQSKDEVISLSPYFDFCKRVCHFEELDYTEAFDIIYYDAFAPSVQPELWETALLEKMYRALKPTGVLTTYCAKGVVKRSLKSLGFRVEGIPGPIGKREMTRAIK
ncbi:tRNA (5-methylaminomethyl-2-thiouridine)(34)-methyltransferase MnmD [Aureispira anguillae]|uniref:tRNA (5-methylaminomethyl-2-thiouridine)(34)-methyltransferase MnmD n=1 Tax=Aureispira anguillae TaxID=2864201 RepID=A0A915YB84_9BACT|nr:tRNA (5-methylaminomethyl-2-thiouridine)(34)-methyltransferase MnmD [Aureispira anguillae]BDS09888.1 tRNA (5-methylaminomethyl-2-thiouridine)(34)-methyltransferase MnmD [Aureispira anguillae]